MKISEVLSRIECPVKSFLKNDLSLKMKSKSTDRKESLSKIFKDDSVKYFSDYELITKKFVEDNLSEELFDSIKEREAYVRGVMLKVERFNLFLSKYRAKRVTFNKKGVISIGKHENIEVRADMVLEDENEVVLLNIMDSEAKLKNGGRTEGTQVNKSIEVYSLYKLGKEFSNGRTVTSGIVYLKERSPLNYMPNRCTEFNGESRYFESIISKALATDVNCEDIECSRYCDYYKVCSYTHSLEEYKAMEVEESMIKERELPVINFSDEQKRVISFNKGFGVVNAVAGAGKTTVLSKRVERLLNLEGCSRDDIVIISFSEKTIDEFKEKLSEKFGIDDFDSVYTFNGFGDKLLKEEYLLFGYKKYPMLMDEITKYDIIKEVIDTSNIITELDDISEIWSNPLGMLVRRLNYDKMFPSNDFGTPLIFQISKIFEYIKSKGVDYTSEEFIEDNFRIFAEEVLKQKRLTGQQRSKILYLYKRFLSKIYGEGNSLYSKYNYILKNRGLYEYQDQINYLVSSFGHPRLKNKFKYKHIICDEFQDSNSLAMIVLKKLSMNSNFESLLVVGDINQSIYGFQGATPENLTGFSNYFDEEVKNFDISYSYRVPQIVARKANGLMASSRTVSYNKMNAFKDDEGYFSNIGSNEELIEKLKKYIKEEKTIGIIARNNDDLNEYIEILVSLDIPYAVKSNLYIMKKPKVINLNSLYKALIDPYKNSYEFLKYLMVADNENFVKNFKTEGFKSYYEEMYLKFAKFIDMKNPVELLDCYYEMIEELSKKDYMIETYLNNIKRRNPKTIHDVAQYCYKLEMYLPTIRVPENNLETNVILTTGHSSKGREFDVVIMDVGTFTATNEEDRRLFYVAMTRAKEILHFVKLKRKINIVSKKNCDEYIGILDNF